MKRIFLTTVLSLALFFAARGQDSASVQGIVVDEETGDPIEGALIKIVGTEKAVVTDSLGIFRFPQVSKGEHDALFTKLGYKSMHKHCLISGDSVCTYEFRMIPLGITTPTVVISGKKVGSKFMEIAEASKILESKELQRKMGQTLAASLQNETGIAVRTLGPAPARPVIRGLGGARITIAKDGLPSTDLSSTSPDHAVPIDPFGLERIEIVRGAEIVKYSTSTLGGAVNAVKNSVPENPPEKFGGFAGGYFESANSGYLLGAGAEAPLGNFAVKGDGSFRKSGNISAPGKVLENTGVESYDADLGVSYSSDRGTIGASVGEFKSSYGIPGGYVGGHPNGVDIDMLKRDYKAKVLWHLHGDFHDALEIRANRSYYRHTEYEGESVGADFVIREYMLDVKVGQRENALFDNGSAGLFFNSRRLTLGGYVFTPPTSSISLAPYVYEEFSIGDFLFQSGIRFSYDNYEPEKNAVADIGYVRPRDFYSFAASVGAMKEALSDFFVGANVSRSSRAPTVEELYNEGPHLAAYSYETGNPDLESERGYGFELFGLLDRGDLRFRANGFWNEMEYFIAPRNTGDTNYSVKLPIYAASGAPARLLGFETRLDYEIFDFVSASNSNAFVYGEFSESGEPLPQIPPFKGTLKITYKTPTIMFFVETEYAANQNRTDRFEESTAGYAILNAGGQLVVAAGGTAHNFSITASNLTNRTYRNHLSRIKSIMPEPGCNLKLVYKGYF